MKPRHDIFESGDATALLCVDETSLQSLVSGQLDALGFKMHNGLFREDVVLRLGMHAYDVVIVYDRFEDSHPDSNPVLEECLRLSPEHRRSFLLVLVGSDYLTEDGLQAFARSVDLVVNIADLANFGMVLRRAATRRFEFYRSFSEMAETVALG